MENLETPVTCDFCGEVFYTEKDKLDIVAVTTAEGEVYACRYICASQLIRKNEEC
jgi:hypothetical protein